MKYEIISLMPLRVENSSYASALNYLVEKGEISIKFIEFSFTKQLKMILLGIEKKYPLKRFLDNFLYIMKLLTSRDKTIIIGAAPFSAVIYLLNILKLKHRCAYFTSWPYWDGKKYPEKVFLPNQKKAWAEFLDNLISVGITDASCSGIAQYGATPYHIPHSVDDEKFVPPVNKAPSDKLRVVYVGKLFKLKGVPLLVNLIKNYKWDNVEFWIVGGGPCEGEFETLEKEKYPVKYLGYVRNTDQLVSIYQESDIMILPSFQENFGIVLIEAMACQLPVISSDCAGPREIVEDGVNGRLVSINNEKVFREAILELARSPELREKFGRKGREKVEAQYSLKVVARKWLEVIKKVHGE